MSITSRRLHDQLLLVTIAGDITVAHIETWRAELRAFLHSQGAEGACGLLVEIGDADSLTFEALDNALDLLAEPDALLGDIRMRIALIGVRGFTQRFLREAMPITPLKNVRARFFHEVARDEARAWVESLPDAPLDTGLPSKTPSEDGDSGSGLFDRLPFGRRKS